MKSAGLLEQFNVSRETLDILDEYRRELLKWNQHINLISKAEENSIETRHIVDSAQIGKFLTADTKRWADFGSGGGLPGIVIAILSKQGGFDAEFHLVESDQRKAAFLRSMKAKFQLNCIVHSKRIEDLASLNVDVISARALAQLSDLLELSVNHLLAQGSCIFLKGESADMEILQAKQNWNFHLKMHRSITNETGQILELSGIERRT